MPRNGSGSSLVHRFLIRFAVLAVTLTGVEATEAQESSSPPPRPGSGIEEIVVLGGESERP